MTTSSFQQRRRVHRAVRKPFGLALGGGGARGIAHAGVLEALADYPALRPSVFAGTSAGAVMAVLAAAGLDVAAIRKFAVEIDWFSDIINLRDLVPFGGTNRAGLFPNTKLAKVVNDLIGRRSFDELEHDVAVIATDIENKRRVIFTSHRVAQRIDQAELERFLAPPAGHLPGAETIVISDVSDVGLAIRASCAVPGFFRPVQIHTMNLVDGGLIDQTPVDVVRAMGAETSMGVSLALSFMPPRLVSPRDALSGTVGMLGVQQLRRSLEMADIGFQVSGIDERSPVRPHQVDLVDIGRRDTHEQLEAYFGAAGLSRLRSGPGDGERST